MRTLNKKQKINIAIGTVLLAFSVIFIYWMQSDNNGQITQPNLQKNQSPPLTTKQLDGKYMTFGYSSQYMVRQRTDRGDDLEVYELDADKPYVKKLAASVSNLPDGTLNSNSAYLLRKSHTDKFQERMLSPEIANTEVWSSTDGSKQTVFITKDKRVAVLAFTQDGGDKAAYNNEVDSIIRSFKWK